LLDQQTLFFDIETTGLDPWDDRIITLQHKLGDGPTTVTDCRRGVPLDIRRMLADPSILKVGHNVAFDLMFLRVAAGIAASNVWDTMLAERVLTLGLNQPTDLSTLANMYTDNPMPPKERGRTFKDISYGDLPEWALDYARQDVDVLPAIFLKQQQKLETNGLLTIAALEFDLVPVVVNMQHDGVRLDKRKWMLVSNELQRKKRCLETKLDGLAGLETQQVFLFEEAAVGAINWQSHVQVLRALNSNGVAVDSTAEDVLRAYLRSDPDNELVETLLFYKGIIGLAKFDLPKHINAKTGRLHPHYDQLGARSGRTSCSDPNLQNVPNPKRPFQRDHGIDFRESFVPAPGHLFIEADYSQIELRILAELSGEPLMISAFRNGRDLHLETARLAFGEPGMPTDDPRRGYAKNGNFCIVYGGGGETLANLLGVTTNRGWEILNGIYAAYPGIRSWQKEAQEKAFRMGFAETIWGRKRYLREPTNEGEKAFLERVAINTPVQGAAADLAKRALVRVQAALPDDPIVLFVHDEIVVETRAERAEEVQGIVEAEMVIAGEEMLRTIPVQVDTKIKKNWGMTG
jgi:DNA polymerase I